MPKNKIQMHSSVLIIWSSNLLEFDIIKYTYSYLKAPLLLNNLTTESLKGKLLSYKSNIRTQLFLKIQT